MKNTFTTIIGALIFGAALPALAGPDWQIIEQARKAKLVKLQQAAKQQAQLTECERQQRLRMEEEAHEKASLGNVPVPDQIK